MNTQPPVSEAAEYCSLPPEQGEGNNDLLLKESDFFELTIPGRSKSGGAVSSNVYTAF